MIICPNCQAEMNEESKFCTECGTSLVEQATQQTQPTQQPNASQITITAPNIDIDLTDVKNKMTNYWQYLLQTAVHPSSSFANTHAIMGWIQVSVIALLTTFILAVFANESYLGLGFIDFVKIFFVQVAASLCPILVSFLVVRFMKKNPISFSQATAQFGGLLSLNVFILALVLIFSFLSPFGLADLILLLLGLTGIINIAAFNIYLYSTDNNSKIDSFIATIIGNVGYLILAVLIIRILLGLYLEGVSGGYLFEDIMYELFGIY